MWSEISDRRNEENIDENLEGGQTRGSDKSIKTKDLGK